MNLRLFVCDPLAKRERSVCHREWHHLVEPSCIMSKLQNLWGGRAAPLASEPRAAAGVSSVLPASIRSSAARAANYFSAHRTTRHIKTRRKAQASQPTTGSKAMRRSDKGTDGTCACGCALPHRESPARQHPTRVLTEVNDAKPPHLSLSLLTVPVPVQMRYTVLERAWLLPKHLTSLVRLRPAQPNRHTRMLSKCRRRQPSPTTSHSCSARLPSGGGSVKHGCVFMF